MSSPSNISAIGAVSSATATGGNTAVTAKPKPAGNAQPLSSRTAVESVVASLGNSDASPLAYNAAGLLGSFPTSTTANSNSVMTSAQQTQAAILEAENTVTQTLASLFSTNTASTTSHSSNSDISSLFSLPGTINNNNLFGLSRNTIPNSTSNGGTAAQNALLATENAITNTLNSLGASSSS
jgi:hypothetical protein